MQVEIPSRSALTDEAFALRVSGLEPGARVVVYATTAGTDATRWESRAAFLSDREGVVDVRRDAPVSGTYREVDGDGLLWSMAPTDEAPGVARFRAPCDSFEVGIAVRLDGFESVHATVERRVAGRGVTCQEVREPGLVGTLFTAVGEGPHPAVALYHGASGGIAGLEPVGALLSSHGFTSLVVGYLGAAGLSKTPREVPLEALAAGVRWLKEQTGVRPAGVGVVGTSVGAEGALAMASWVPDPDLRAVVAVSPTSVVWQALAEGHPVARPRWTAAGRALPFAALASERLLWQLTRNGVLRAVGGRAHPLRTVTAYEAGLRHRRAVAAAAIPVERIAAPLLLIASRDDQVWPAVAMAEHIVKRRRSHGRGAQDRLVTFEDAGHLTLHVPGVPTTGRIGCGGTLALGGSPAGDARATAAVWREILTFLDAHLRDAAEVSLPGQAECDEAPPAVEPGAESASLP